MHFTLRSFIAQPDDQSWSQYWEIEPDNPSLVSTRGHLFGLVSFTLSEVADTSKIGRELISDINQQFYAASSLDSLSHLRQILENYLNPLTDQFSQISLILGSVQNDTLFIAILNSGHCIIRRQNQISSLLVGDSGQIAVATGPVKPNDRFFFCTDDFFQQITWEKIKSSLNLHQIQDLEENFLADLHSSSAKSTQAALFFQINQDVTLEESTYQPPQVVSPVPSEVKVDQKPVYVSTLQTSNLKHRKQVNLIFSLLTLVALSVTIFLGYRQNQISSNEKKYQTLKNQISEKISNAKAIKELSLTDAQKIASDAKALSDALISLKIHSTESSQLQQEITDLLSETGSADSYRPELLFDTTLFNPDSKYSKMALVNNNLYLLDSQLGRISLLDINRKSNQNITTSTDLSNSTDIAINDGKIYVLKNNFVSVIANDKVETVIDISQDIKNFVSGQIRFWNGSLYLLDLTNSSLWKYSPSSSGFSKGSSWLKDKQVLPVDSTSFAINGSIWVISKNGQIAAYSRGVREDRQFSTANSHDNATHLTTSVDSELLAFSDRDNLVYVYQKDGKSPRVYNLGDKKIIDLVLSPETNSVIALCQDMKLYQVKLDKIN